MSGQPVMDRQPVMDVTLETTIDKAMEELLDVVQHENYTFHYFIKRRVDSGWDEDYAIEVGEFVEYIFFGNIKVNIVETICENTDKFIDYVKNIKGQVQNWGLIEKYSKQLPDNRQISREWYYDGDFYQNWNQNPTEYKQAFILSLIIPELSIPSFYEHNDYTNAVKINYGAVQINLGNYPSEVYPRHTIANLINDFKELEKQKTSDEEIKKKIYEKYSLDEDITEQILENKKKNIYEILDIILVKNFGMKLSAINLYLLYGFYKYIISISGSNTGTSDSTTGTSGSSNDGSKPSTGKDPKTDTNNNEMSNVIIRF